MTPCHSLRSSSQSLLTNQHARLSAARPPQIKRVTGVANSAGRWSVRLGLLGSGLVSSGPFTLTASRPGYSMTRSDVLVGEVSISHEWRANACSKLHHEANAWVTSDQHAWRWGAATAASWQRAVSSDCRPGCLLLVGHQRSRHSTFLHPSAHAGVAGQRPV